MVLGSARVQANPPNPPHGDGVHPGGGNGGLDNSGHGYHRGGNENPPPPPPDDPPPKDPPPDDPPPPDKQPAVSSGASTTSTSNGLNQVAGATGGGHAPTQSPPARSAGTVIVKPHTQLGVTHHKAKANKTKAAKPV